MAWDLATAKARLNITGTAQDGVVQAALDASLDMIERYCNRRFMYASEKAKFYYTAGETLFLDRYPVEQVVAVNSGTTAISKYKVHKSFGTILFPGRTGGDEIDVDYSGGYKVLPPDLELILWSVFDNLWPTMSGAGSSVAAGAIESITIPDVGTVRYGSGSGGAGSGASSGSAIYGSFFDALRLYRRELC